MIRSDLAAIHLVGLQFLTVGRGGRRQPPGEQRYHAARRKRCLWRDLDTRREWFALNRFPGPERPRPALLLAQRRSARPRWQNETARERRLRRHLGASPLIEGVRFVRAAKGAP